MEKLLLCAFFTCDELDIIDKENINVVSVFVFEFCCFSVLYSIYQLIGKLISPDIHNFQAWMKLSNVIRYSILKVCFPYARRSIYEERIIYLATRIICSCLCYSYRDLIGFAGNKAIKSKLGIKENRSRLWYNMVYA